MKVVHVWDKSLKGMKAMEAAVAEHCSLSRVTTTGNDKLVVLGCGNRHHVENIVHETISEILKAGNLHQLNHHQLSIFVAKATIATADESLCHQVAADIIGYAGLADLTPSHVNGFCRTFVQGQIILVDLFHSIGSDVRSKMIHDARVILWIEALTFFTSHTIVWQKSPDPEVPT